jgi:hypothetical protein
MDSLQSPSENSLDHENHPNHFHTGLYISHIIYLILDNPLSQTLPTLWPNGTFKVSFSCLEAPMGWDKSSWA